MSKNKFSIVVDADIARASGKTEHPTSSACRDVLELMLTNKHRIVVCQELKAEWKKHSSYFAHKWFASMASKNLVQHISPDRKIKQALSGIEKSSKNIQIALKDSHIIDAARHTGMFVTSNDEKAKSAFQRLDEIQSLVRGIIWANPVRDLPNLKKKLNNGIRADPLPRLGHAQSATPTHSNQRQMKKP